MTIPVYAQLLQSPLPTHWIGDFFVVREDDLSLRRPPVHGEVRCILMRNGITGHAYIVVRVTALAAFGVTRTAIQQVSVDEHLDYEHLLSVVNKTRLLLGLPRT